MAIEVRCPFCDKLLRAKDSMAGRTAKCPSCGAAVKLPGAGAGGAADEVVDGEAIDAEPQLPEEEPAEDAGRRPCPMCGESISVKAVRCRHCGEDLRSPTGKSRRKSSDPEDMTTGDWLLCIFCGGIGCIMGIVYLAQGKSKGGKMIGFSLLFSFLWRGIGAIIQIALENVGP